MGIISLEKSNHLYWLGRYSERAFTIINTFMEAYDRMLDADANAYQNVCQKLSIPDIYGSKESFVVNYLFDEDDPNSVYSNLKRACDNAMVLRDMISSTSLSYIQLALDIMAEDKRKDFCLLDLQDVLDYLYAFWGSIDDYVESSECRNILKFGRYIERMDLYIRLDYDKKAIMLAYDRMKYRLSRSNLSYSELDYNIFSGTLLKGEDLNQALWNLNNIYKD